MTNRRVAGLCIAVVVLGAGCSSSSSHQTLTVFAAASLTESFNDLGRQFEAQHHGVKVRLDFGASSTLAQQINQGAPADVFASAAVKNMQQAIDAHSVATSTNFASNVAEIAVAPSARGRVHSLADLAAPGVKVALCQAQVPCGALALTVLKNAGVHVRPVTEALDVKSALSAVTTGQVDAAIVYVTDVRAAGQAVVGVPVPSSVNARTEYPIAVVSASKHRTLAEDFVQFVLSSSGRDVLASAGFGTP
jgi:molybdate transport system substrate-binding protein